MSVIQRQSGVVVRLLGHQDATRKSTARLAHLTRSENAKYSPKAARLGIRPTAFDRADEFGRLVEGSRYNIRQ
jgi:hypothetical protein